MSKALIAIDPGKGGGMALFVDGRAAEAYAFKEADEAAEWVKSVCMRYELVEAVIEQVGAMPGQGVTSMFSFGENFGWWQGLLMGVGIPFTRVRPQEWQKGLPGLTKLKGADRKRRLKSLAAEQFPALKPTLKTCDALLIGSWATKQGGAA